MFKGAGLCWTLLLQDNVDDIPNRDNVIALTFLPILSMDEVGA